MRMRIFLTMVLTMVLALVSVATAWGLWFLSQTAFATNPTCRWWIGHCDAHSSEMGVLTIGAGVMAVIFAIWLWQIAIRRWG